jgi:hypothetical protein
MINVMFTWHKLSFLIVSYFKLHNTAKPAAKHKFDKRGVRIKVFYRNNFSNFILWVLPDFADHCKMLISSKIPPANIF